jgi:hypothetical protein
MYVMVVHVLVIKNSRSIGKSVRRIKTKIDMGRTDSDVRFHNQENMKFIDKTLDIY